MSQPIKILKASGDRVDFNADKLKQSLENSGAGINIIASILREVDEILYDGISTKEIYKKAFSLLRKYSRPVAAKYKLKKAIMELGPTGFPFEKFVGVILQQQGFVTNVGVIVQGHCINHEVDVVAQKDSKHFMIECKFHRTSGRHCDVKIPLYIQSRFKDVEKQWKKRPGHDTKFHQGWIFTNTRFTSDAIKYGNCAGLKLISWDYPKTGSLKQRIDIAGLHPITCLTTISKTEKQKLLELNVVLSKDICEKPDILHEIGVKINRHKRILSESHELCNDN
jgi:Restriction endonuclease